MCAAVELGDERIHLMLKALQPSTDTCADDFEHRHAYRAITGLTPVDERERMSAQPAGARYRAVGITDPSSD